ncbi:MAG: 2-succinyl-5-enolpyruvyl-6-hydroxy-3-cyclohexene-1-carboxylic-acid synthase [Nocardioidaceae bacterium]
MNDSTLVARAVLAALIRADVTDVVLAPGSRSAPLAMAMYDADASGNLRLHVRIDERTAGFLALGLSKGSHRPVAVVTTSGTAVANLYPAILEAKHAGVPLVVLSADRPEALRGTGANQTTEQPGIFGPLVPCDDIVPADREGAAAAVEAAVRRLGPSHVNLQFAEPLLATEWSTSPDDHAARDVQAGHDDQPKRRNAADSPLTLPLGPRTVMVAGDDAGPPARLLAERANWPLLAEPTSGSRTGTHALRTYRLLLRTSLSEGIDRVVVAGHPTLSRPVTELFSRRDIEVVSVRDRSGIATDPARVARHLDAMPEVNGSDPPDWLHSWLEADRKLSDVVDGFVASDADALPLHVAREVAAAVTPEALLVVGSSQPVRDLDIMATPYPAGQRRLIIGNRGLAGIDGMVSTAVGAALGRRSSRSLAYVGDVTFLHDSTGLVLGPEEARPDLTIVVANDDGGAIFSTLEQGAPEFSSAFERLFGTPHRVDLAALCAATRTAYERIEDAEHLRDALSRQPAGIRVIEVSLPRSGRRRLDAALRALAADVL